MIALTGVRISWLMVARKVLLARLASMALSFSTCNAPISCLDSVMSFQPQISVGGVLAGSWHSVNQCRIRRSSVPLFSTS
ncbi:hypothetical protein D3C71_1648360 [compost metagenome]